MEVAVTSGSSGPSAPTTAAVRPDPPSASDVVMSAVDATGLAAASGGQKSIAGSGTVAGSGVGSGSGSGVGGADNVAPATASMVGTAVAMEVDAPQPQPRPGAESPPLPPPGGTEDRASHLSIDLSGGPPAVDVAAPPATEDVVACSADGGSGQQAIEVAKASVAPPPPATSAAPLAPSPSKDTRVITAAIAADGDGNAGLGKRPHSTMGTDLVVEIDGDALAAERGGGGEPPPRPAKHNLGKETLPFFGLRGVPGPDLGPFFRGSALDAKAVRKEGSGASGGGGGGGGRKDSRLAAIAEGLRRMGKSAARTPAEAAAAEAMATRVSDGSATHEVAIVLCLWVLAGGTFMRNSKTTVGWTMELPLREWRGIQ